MRRCGCALGDWVLPTLKSGLASETNLSNILATLGDDRPPDLIIINSIQTLWADTLDAAPGTVSQVRAAAQALIRYAKMAGSALLLVGHVTKDGQIAGPKVIEHMVDTVLYFEGDRGLSYRILRAVKNRFGPSDEIGVFEMVTGGLQEVANPSELFLGDRDGRSPGAAVFAGVEGTRPLARRNSSPGRAVRARDATPRRRRLGQQPPRHASGRARRPLRRLVLQPRRLSECGRRPQNYRTRRGFRGRCGASVVNFGRCAAA